MFELEEEIREAMAGDDKHGGGAGVLGGGLDQRADGGAGVGEDLVAEGLQLGPPYLAGDHLRHEDAGLEQHLDHL